MEAHDTSYREVQVTTMFDLDKFLSLAEKQEPGRVKNAMLAAAGEIVGLQTWQERVCDAVQPAQNADEWGADVADIIVWRLAELATATAALEDKHRAWVAAERELEAARAGVGKRRA
jgi:hypothetical protein